MCLSVSGASEPYEECYLCRLCRVLIKSVSKDFALKYAIYDGSREFLPQSGTDIPTQSQQSLRSNVHHYISRLQCQLPTSSRSVLTSHFATTATDIVERPIGWRDKNVPLGLLHLVSGPKVGSHVKCVLYTTHSIQLSIEQRSAAVFQQQGVSNYCSTTIRLGTAVGDDTLEIPDQPQERRTNLAVESVFRAKHRRKTVH